MTQQIQGVLRPMPEYGVHYRAGVMFDKRGREFIVDDAAVAKAKSDTAAQIQALEKKITTNADDEQQRNERIELLKGELHRLTTGVLEELDKPLRFSTKLYEYMREGFGRQLVCDTWDGSARPPEVKALTVDERLARLETNFNEILAILKAQKK